MAKVTKFEQKPKIIGRKKWKKFEEEQRIISKLKEINVEESFDIPLKRDGIKNGLGDLGRDGKRGGAKMHVAFVVKEHPTYKVEKKPDADDQKNKKNTHLTITKLKQANELHRLEIQTL